MHTVRPSMHTGSKKCPSMHTGSQKSQYAYWDTKYAYCDSIQTGTNIYTVRGTRYLWRGTAYDPRRPRWRMANLTLRAASFKSSWRRLQTFS